MGLLAALLCFATLFPATLFPAILFFREKIMHKKFNLTTPRLTCVAGVDVVSTDAWYSMGQEDEKESRRRAFEGFRVDERMMAAAGGSAIFLHCLPAHREEEVTSAVLDSAQSRIWPQAHNRMHTFRGLLAWLVAQGSIA